MPRPALLLAAALAAVAASACDDPAPAFPADGAPAALHFETFGFVPYLLRVDAVGDTVLFEARYEGSGTYAVAPTRRVPTRAEWAAFWQAVRDAGVDRWPARCEASAIETSGFAYTLAWSGARREGRYTNAYATAAGRCSTTDYSAGDRFYTAVLALAGAPARVRAAAER